MSKNKRFRVDTTQSAIITDAATFPPEASSPDKNQRQQAVYPLRIYEGANYLPTAHGYKSYFGTESKLAATGLPNAAIEEIITYQTSTFATGLLALTDAGLYANFGGDWEVLLDMPEPAEANRSFQWTWCIINSLLFLYRQDLGYVVVLEEYQNDSGLLMDTFNGMTVTPQLANRPAGYPVGAFTFTPTTLNMEGQIGIFRAGSTLGFWDSDNAVAWSALNDLTDFTPDLTTLANITKLGRLRGNITTIQGMGKSFVVYATRSILMVNESDESLIRFKADVIMSAVGVSYPKEVAVAMPDFTHFAWTNMGLLQIDDGQAKPIVPDFSDYVKRTRTPQYLSMLNNRYLCIGVMDPKFVTGNIELSAQTVDPEDIDWDGVVSPGADVDGIHLDGQEVCFTVTETAEPEYGTKPYVILPLYRHWVYSGASIRFEDRELNGETIKAVQFTEGELTTTLGHSYYPMKVITAELATFETDQLDEMERVQRAIYSDKYGSLPTVEERKASLDWAMEQAMANRMQQVADNIEPAIKSIRGPKGLGGKSFFIAGGNTGSPSGYVVDGLLLPNGVLAGIGYYQGSGGRTTQDDWSDVLSAEMLEWLGDKYWVSLYDNSVEDLNVSAHNALPGAYSFTPGTPVLSLYYDIAKVPDTDPAYMLLTDKDLLDLTLVSVQPGRLAYRLEQPEAKLYGAWEVAPENPITFMRDAPLIQHEQWYVSFGCQARATVIAYTASFHVTYMSDKYPSLWGAEVIEYQADVDLVSSADSTSVVAYAELDAADVVETTKFRNEWAEHHDTRIAEKRAELNAIGTDIGESLIGSMLGDEAIVAYEVNVYVPTTNTALSFIYKVTTGVTKAYKESAPVAPALLARDFRDELYGKQPTAPLEESTPMQWNRSEELRGLMAVDEWWFNRNRNKDELDATFLIGGADRVQVPLGMTLAEADAYGPPYDVTAQATWGNRYVSWTGSENWDPNNSFVVGENGIRLQQRLVCGVTDPIDVPPVVIPPIVWEPWEEEIPPLTWLLSNGQRAPYYPTMYGMYVFDLQLGKWGKYVGEHKTLVDYQAINNASGESVSYGAFMVDAGVLKPDRSVALFTSTPDESYVRYGKYQHLDSVTTQFREVVVEFAERANAMVTLNLSLNGKQLEYGYSDALLVKDALRAELLSDKVGAWGTVTVSGHYDLTRMVIKSSKAGDR